jgi:uncharacterized membrane protein
MTDTAKRTLVKTILWRISVASVSFVITYAITGDAQLAGLLIASKAILNTIWYYLYERIWNRISWGKINNV